MTSGLSLILDLWIVMVYANPQEHERSQVVQEELLYGADLNIIETMAGHITQLPVELKNHRGT